MPYVDYQRQGRVALITLHRPERLNAFGSGLAAGVRECFARFLDDGEAHVAVLRGAGRAFCAGVDAKEIAETGRIFLREDPLSFLYPFGSPQMTKPVIAAVQGYCLGAGFNLLVMQTDIRIAADTAIFGLPEIDRGIYCLSTLFYHQLPRNIVMELTLLGNNITAQRAYELGIVNRVVPEAELLPAALEVANKLAGFSPLAVRLTKEGVLKMSQVAEAAFLRENALFRQSANSQDMVEGMKAWVEKRPPQWKGQ